MIAHNDLPACMVRRKSLSERSWFGTGGVADWYAEPRTADDFHSVIAWSLEQHLPLTVIGDGANILINDAGVAGITVRPQMHDITESDMRVTAGAGVPFASLIDFCLDHGLLGLEEFSGIPGSVGGSIFINIHYFDWLLSSFVESATVIDRHTGLWSVVDRAWFSFGYNYSRLHEGDHYLVDATFGLRKGTDAEIAYARGRSAEIIRHRKQRYPRERTCGSFFRNFYDHEVTVVSNGKKMIYVAYYLDKLGIKGSLAVGGAQVSYHHANMIVTRPGATSADVIELARTMQALVFQEFHILPQPECRFIGFQAYPLMVV